MACGASERIITVLRSTFLAKPNNIRHCVRRINWLWRSGSGKQRYIIAGPKGRRVESLLSFVIPSLGKQELRHVLFTRKKKKKRERARGGRANNLNKCLNFADALVYPTPKQYRVFEGLVRDPLLFVPRTQQHPKRRTQ